jgi:hypothetical protein
LPGLDGSEWLGEDVGQVVVDRDVCKVKSFILFNMVTEPVVADVDVPGTVLIDGVLEQRKGALIVAVESYQLRREVDEWLEGIKEMLSPDNVLARLGACPIL